jgi:hypothetical protein
VASWSRISAGRKAELTRGKTPRPEVQFPRAIRRPHAAAPNERQQRLPMAQISADLAALWILLPGRAKDHVVASDLQVQG